LLTVLLLLLLLLLGSGLVGHKAVKLVLMGDTVEVARQLAASGASTGCHISRQVYLALSDQERSQAMPWTLQQLAGYGSPQHTYLLPHPEAAAAAGWQAHPEQQQQAFLGSAPASSGVGLSKSVPLAAAAAAGGPAVVPEAAAAPQTASTVPSVSGSRLAVDAAAAMPAAGVTGPGTAAADVPLPLPPPLPLPLVLLQPLT